MCACVCIFCAFTRLRLWIHGCVFLLERKNVYHEDNTQMAMYI